jgi:hypothetical protein
MSAQIAENIAETLRATHPMKPLSPALDELFPPRGECAFCELPDARHRLWDAIRGCVAAGDPPLLVADEYDLPMHAVDAVLAIPEDEYRRWKRRLRTARRKAPAR